MSIFGIFDAGYVSHPKNKQISRERNHPTIKCIEFWDMGEIPPHVPNSRCPKCEGKLRWNWADLDWEHWAPVKCPNDFTNLGNEIFGTLTYHSTERPSRYAAHEAAGEQWTTYDQYLKTKHWMNTRVEALKRSGFECALCRFKGKLDVHHKTYERLGHEDPEDLIALCRKCHSRHHGFGGLDAL